MGSAGPRYQRGASLPRLGTIDPGARWAIAEALGLPEDGFELRLHVELPPSAAGARAALDSARLVARAAAAREDAHRQGLCREVVEVWGLRLGEAAITLNTQYQHIQRDLRTYHAIHDGPPGAAQLYQALAHAECHTGGTAEHLTQAYPSRLALLAALDDAVRLALALTERANTDQEPSAPCRTEDEAGTVPQLGARPQAEPAAPQLPHPLIPDLHTLNRNLAVLCADDAPSELDVHAAQALARLLSCACAAPIPPLLDPGREALEHP